MNTFFPLDIERYSKRYMKVYKEEWIPGNYKAKNVRMIFKDFFLPHIFRTSFLFLCSKIESVFLQLISNIYIMKTKMKRCLYCKKVKLKYFWGSS